MAQSCGSATAGTFVTGNVEVLVGRSNVSESPICSAKFRHAGNVHAPTSKLKLSGTWQPSMRPSPSRANRYDWRFRRTGVPALDTRPQTALDGQGLQGHLGRPSQAPV